MGGTANLIFCTKKSSIVLNNKTDDSGKGGESDVFVYQQFRPYLPTHKMRHFLLIHHLKNEPLPVIIHKAQQFLYRYFLENLRL